MRESILHELYFGNITPWERSYVRTREYTALAKKIDSIIMDLQKLLSPEEYGKFEEIQNLRAQVAAIEDTDLFKYSFCLGALLMMEVMNFKNRICD